MVIRIMQCSIRFQVYIYEFLSNLNSSEIQWYKYLENCPSKDNNVKLKMQRYCGSVGDTLPFATSNFTMPRVNNKYSTNNLYCKWSYWGVETDKYLLIEYLRYDRRHVFTVEGELVDDTPFSYNISRDNFVFNAIGVKYFTFHFFSYQDFDSPPFEVSMSYQKLGRSAMSVFLSVGTIVIFVMLFSILVYRCYIGLKMRRQLRREAAHHERQINYILANNPGIIANIQQDPQAEQIIKNKNKKEIEKLLETDLKPHFYKEHMNEFNATCTICMESFAEEKSEVTVLFCKHIFHHGCLKNWLFKNLTHPKCPNCNYNVIDRSSQPPVVSYNANQTNNNNVSHIHDNTHNNLNIVNNNPYPNINHNNLNVNIQQTSARRVNDSNSNNRYVGISTARVSNTN